MLFWKSLWKIQLPFCKITKGKGKYIYNPEMNIYSRSGIVKFHFFNSVPRFTTVPLGHHQAWRRSLSVRNNLQDVSKSTFQMFRSICKPDFISCYLLREVSPCRKYPWHSRLQFISAFIFLFLSWPSWGRCCAQVCAPPFCLADHR